MRRIEGDEVETSRIMLGLLDAVEQERAYSQRHLAAELGIALGLVNAYLKRCIKKGLVKVRQAPARRYAYYLTPQGFAEKSRLTIEYLAYSFSFFRQARADCARTLAEAREKGWDRLVLAGVSDLAEIAAICALESGAKIIAVADGAAAAVSFMGAPVVRSFDAIDDEVDAVVITDLHVEQSTIDAAVARFGRDRVLSPTLLGLRLDGARETKP